MVSTAGSTKHHGRSHDSRSYVHNDIRTAVTYSQSALATSAPLAWLYVGCLSVTFAMCCWALQWMHPINKEHWDTFNQHVPSWVFTAQVAAFGGIFVLNVINLMFCSAPVQYNCNVLLALIHGVAFVTDYLLDAQATPVVVSWGGRLFVPLRYIQWTHTTPTMILLMAMMSSTSTAGVVGAMLADLVMVLTGLAATWTSGVPQLVFLAISMIAFFFVMAAIIAMFRGALAETQQDQPVHSLMERFLWLTLLVWSLFPLVWTLAWLGYVSLSTEQLFWGLSDYGAKVVFSSHLWQKNLATVQQRREAAQELLRALDRGVLLERLRGLLAAKERLVHALQHELTTPIHGMMALVQELLHNKTQSASSRTRMLLMIRSSAVCLLNTISTAINSSSAPDGLHGTRNGSDSPSGRRVHKVYLWRVAESVVRLTRPLMRDHVRIVNCISKDMPPVKGDSARLMQVLMNLVCSSLKYTHSGSIKISASLTHSLAQVMVADTGAGIPSQQLQQALDPFELTAGQNGPGSTPPELWDVCRTGLGLYLVKQTLASMSSTLAASSELGKGSTFEFDMPLADSDCESESEADAELFSEPSSLRGSLDLTGLGEMSNQGRRSFDYVGPTGADSSGSSRGLQSSAMLRAAAAAEAAAGSNGVGTTLLCGAGGVGSAAGSVDAAAAAGAGLVQKQNHRIVHNGVIQVLSVDDDKVNQLVASTALKIHNWEVVKCMSGAEALDYLLQKCTVLPDLVLLDVMMPTVSGYEVAKRIREVWPSSVLPIIMVSAKTEEDDIVQGLRCGADDYVPKPFKRAELAARIRAHIRARDAFQQQQATEQQWMLQHNLLPLNVQRKLRNGETVIAESHPAATVLWAEVLGPTAAAASGMGAAAAAAAAAGSSAPLQEALNRISSQQQLAAAAAAADQAADGAADAAASNGVSRSGSLLGLSALDVSGPLSLGAFAPGLSPAEAVVRLNSLYTTWEELCAKQNVLGVDFSGSSFVAVSGHDDHPNHTSLILRAAAAMLSVAAATKQPDGSPLAVRLGIHTGPLTTGLVGSKAVKLVLMGDTVEGARQLAATGCPGAAHISSEVHAALQAPAVAAAAPWTHQRLPGSTRRLQTYLLRTDEASSSSSSSIAAGSGTVAVPVGQQQPQQQAKDQPAASSAAAATAKVGQTSGSLAGPSAPGTPATAAVESVAAAAGPHSPGRVDAVSDTSESSSPCPQQQPEEEDGDGQIVLPPREGPSPDSVTNPPAGGSSSSRAQQQPQQQYQQSGLLSPVSTRQLSTGTADSPPPSRVAVATAVSSLAVNSSGPLAVPSRSRRSSSDSRLPARLAAAQPAAAATAATAAMVACLTGSNVASSGLFDVASQGDMASMLALQQAGSTLISQLGAERRQLQEQLLERTQQHAAAAAELACLKQQLGQANATAEQRGQQVEQMQQQMSALLVRAHLADCWQALATMKAQVGTLGGGLGSLPQWPQLPQQWLSQLAALGQSQPADQASFGGGAAEQIDQQLQMLLQRRQQLQQQQLGQVSGPVSATGSGGSAGMLALLQQTQHLQQQLVMQQQQQASVPSHHQALVPAEQNGVGPGFPSLQRHQQQQQQQQKQQ